MFLHDFFFGLSSAVPIAERKREEDNNRADESYDLHIVLFSYNDLHNLRGQSPMPKPDAAIPRQVDAVVSP